MELKYTELTNNASSLAYSILNNKGVEMGRVEGYVAKEALITVLHINEEYQNKGIGFMAFKKVYDELGKKNTISQIIGSWHSDEEFSYCEDGMSTNLKIFLHNINKGLSDTQSALNTPTGKWAQRLGFNKCDILRNTSGSVEVAYSK